MVANALSGVTGTRFAITLALVGLASAVIMATLVVFGVKAYRQEGSARQFRLSSLFLLIVPIAIYSTAIRAITATAPLDVGLLGWLIVAVASVLFMFISTVILLWLANSLMWYAVFVVRAIAAIRRGNQASDE
ncbi:MAG: hypothetical protein CMJ64_15990 [Planctomycetaceae bacterium]|jgi:hypothetical protein|nr:hypothetical protein [Planctomycetaceae bacterium]